MITILKYLRNPWVITAIVVVIALVLWKYRGPIISVFNPAPLPNAGSTGVNLTGQQARMVRSLSQRLWTDIDKWNNPWFSQRDTATWVQLQEQDDQLFIAVYNDFGNLHYGNAGKTLKDYLRDENFAFTTSVFAPWSIWSGGRLKDAILERMDNLNLQ